LEHSIVERIDEDLDLHAKRKKLLRLADAEFLAGQTPDRPNYSFNYASSKSIKANGRQAGPAPMPILSIFS
jgi:hypothetical protein